MRLIRLITVLAALAGAGPAFAQGPPATAVAVAPLMERDVHPSIRLVGNVRAERVAVIAAETPGLVAEFVAQEGQFLKKGDVICRLDATNADLWVKQAQAELGSLEARLAEAKNGTRPEILAQLKAGVEEAQAMVDKWAFERERITRLFETKQGSAKEHHDTEMEYLAATRRLSQATALYEAAVNGPRQEELERAAFDVAVKRAALERLKRDAEKTAIRAPFDGALVAKRTEVGEWINEGGPVCELVALDKVKVRVDVPETAIAFSQPGHPASVLIEALGETREGKISRVIPMATPSARTFPVEIDLENPDHRVLPGMFVWANTPSGPLGKRLMAPRDAIVTQGTSKRLFVIRPGPNDAPMAMPLAVETGMEVAGHVEVRGAGLTPGDQVVVRANERLFGPTPVIVQPVSAPAAAAASESTPKATP